MTAPSSCGNPHPRLSSSPDPQTPQSSLNEPPTPTRDARGGKGLTGLFYFPSESRMTPSSALQVAVYRQGSVAVRIPWKNQNKPRPREATQRTKHRRPRPQHKVVDATVPSPPGYLGRAFRVGRPDADGPNRHRKNDDRCPGHERSRAHRGSPATDLSGAFSRRASTASLTSSSIPGTRGILEAPRTFIAPRGFQCMSARVTSALKSLQIVQQAGFVHQIRGILECPLRFFAKPPQADTAKPPHLASWDLPLHSLNLLPPFT